MNLPARKTIFIAISQGFASRYILRTDILKTLVNSKCRIVILSPSYSEKYFTTEFSAENIFHEEFKIKNYINRSKLKLLFTLSRQFSFTKPLYSADFKKGLYFDRRKHLSIKKKFFDLALKTVIKLLSNSKSFRYFFCWIERILTKRIHQDLFDKYKPDLLITPSLGMLPYDREIMHEAKLNKVKTLSIVLSWDNTTTKGVPGAYPDYAIAWTEIMKKELLDYHDMPESKVFVYGVANYDDYFNDASLDSKQALCDKFRLDPNKKTILLCLESPTIFKKNPDMIRDIVDIFKQENLQSKCQLLIRLHPIYFKIKNDLLVYKEDLAILKAIQTEYESFAVFDYPEINSQKMSFDMPKSEVYKLGGELKLSDLVISYYSSMAIEASLFDKPSINIELYHRVNHHKDALAHYDHNIRIFETGSITRCDTKQSLANAIKLYLENPSLHSEGRKKVVEQECLPNPGQAGRLIGEKILGLLNE